MLLSPLGSETSLGDPGLSTDRAEIKRKDESPREKDQEVLRKEKPLNFGMILRSLRLEKEARH